jgi:general secretion pathway protein N
MATVTAALVLTLILLAALIYAAPAAWLARYISEVSQGRVLLAQTRGLWHDGSALLVLTSGAGGADAVHWPRRVTWSATPRTPLRWSLRFDWPDAGPPLPATLTIGFSGWALDAGPWRGAVPLAAFSGLGAPFNTLALEGEAQIALGTLHFASAGATQNTAPNVEITVSQLRSALAQGVVLGDYAVRGQFGTKGGSASGTFTLSTRQGALLLDGHGQCTPTEGAGGSSARISCGFNGTARAARHDDALLGNLLGLLGKIQPQPQVSFSGNSPVTELRW